VTIRIGGKKPSTCCAKRHFQYDVYFQARKKELASDVPPIEMRVNCTTVRQVR
jgi:hypothetical protein